MNAVQNKLCWWHNYCKKGNCERHSLIYLGHCSRIKLRLRGAAFEAQLSVLELILSNLFIWKQNKIVSFYLHTRSKTYESQVSYM